jgi:hypothetical protein
MLLARQSGAATAMPSIVRRSRPQVDVGIDLVDVQSPVLLRRSLKLLRFAACWLSNEPGGYSNLPTIDLTADDT